ncbi:MAG: prolipoprotein diacylglyceryl transferase [Bryobacterales bacterium]|nr:prolipoprotein diacylglyceryl transferase [Bryobacterales bacterium]
MLPYLTPPPVNLAGLWFHWSVLLAVLGVLVAHFLLLRRARRTGLDVPTAAAMSLSMVLAGAAGARLFKLVYMPAVLANIDWPSVLLVGGMASFGGLAGGLAGAALYFAARRIPAFQALNYLDALAAVFPMGWILGRTGCALVHDHPGLASTSPLAVAYPDMPRFDLAVIEVLFLAAFLIPLFVWLARRPQPRGLFLSSFFVLYGAFRLWLDTLHVDPPRYAGITVDQWAYGSMFLAGLLLTTVLRPFRKEVFA